jgi:hypothetical protein
MPKIWNNANPQNYKILGGTVANYAPAASHVLSVLFGMRWIYNILGSVLH